MSLSSNPHRPGRCALVRAAAATPSDATGAPASDSSRAPSGAGPSASRGLARLTVAAGPPTASSKTTGRMPPAPSGRPRIDSAEPAPSNQDSDRQPNPTQDGARVPPPAARRPLPGQTSGRTPTGPPCAAPDLEQPTVENAEPPGTTRPEHRAAAAGRSALRQMRQRVVVVPPAVIVSLGGAGPGHRASRLTCARYRAHDSIAGCACRTAPAATS